MSGHLRYSEKIQTVLTFPSRCVWFCYTHIATNIGRRWITVRTGSDEHNDQYSADGCVTRARYCLRVLTRCSVKMLCSVHACLLSTWYMSGSLCPSKGRKQTTFYRHVRSRYKIRPPVLKPGNSSYPLPPNKTLRGADHALQRAWIAPRPR